MPRSATAKQLREELRRAEWMQTFAAEKYRRVSNKELVSQQSYLEEKLVESEDQVPLNMSIAFQKFRPLRHSRSSFLELVEKCYTLLLRLQVSNLSHDIRIVTSDADEFHAEAKMWKERAAVAEDAARAAAAALAKERVEKLELQRQLDEYRKVVEQARRMSRCKYVKFTSVVHLETLWIGVALKVSDFDFGK